ncbi:NADPH-dependent FMN reductase [Amycolatopsis pithecellobii]|uniref:FMN reductase n=1 Tax=Amycolatopsis pithecellobii TaxID=664692 RepID=A0A6N7Z105_9PSEU|nr:NAD(P)H-dependent oxidoreductase [Amycolatopsis pithecellobii]MTD53174.1 FMN reductase [Amycolatopsis pithecellobii]
MTVDQHPVREPVRILAFGGSTRPGSSSERALRTAARTAERLGARVKVIAGPDLMLPLYQPEAPTRAGQARVFVGEIRRADGILLASPGYHGTMSGLVKNALDYLEDLRDAERTYLDGVPVGCIAVAHGWQAAVSTVHNLRMAVHALRGWPTPLGVAVNAAETSAQERIDAQLESVAAQVVHFATARIPVQA